MVRAKKKPAKARGKKASAKKRSAQTLSHQERKRKLHPLNALDADRVARAWAATPGLRVDGLTRARLLSLKRKADRAHAKEDDLARKNEEKLRPLRDARLAAADLLWRAVLDVKAQAEVLARHRPEVEERFTFLTDLFRHAKTAPSVAPVK